jgi:hypothetical protein
MFLLNDQPLAVDTAFTHNEISYPANWLRLATEAEKSAIGITEVADPVRADDRFYWNGDVNLPKALDDKEEVDQDGNPLYVKAYDPVTESMVDTTERLVTKGLKSQFIAQVKQTAGSILAQTDWYVTRQAETAVATPTEVSEYRASVRAKANELEVAIKAVATVEELAALDLSFPAK